MSRNCRAEVIFPRSAPPPGAAPASGTSGAKSTPGSRPVFPEWTRREEVAARSERGLDLAGWMIYTSGLYQEERTLMTTTARLFRNGRSQAVRLPREFRFEGDRVRVHRAGRGVLVEPMFADVADWFTALDRFGPEPFMAEGRRQPPTPERALFRS